MGLLLLVLTLGLRAELPPGQWPLKEYHADHGLANETPLAMTQDAQGFLWVGAEQGVFRFDGIRFRACLSPEAKPLAEARVLQANADGIWVGAPSGLFVVQGRALAAVRWERLRSGIRTVDRDILKRDAQDLIPMPGMWV